MDSELEAFKTDIDLRAYAAGQGYQLDRKESWRGSAVMRHPNDDKIIIKRDVDGHYVFFSVRDETDNGSIIDFVKRRLKLSLGAVRKELRPWIGMPSSILAPYSPLPRIAKDRIRVERQYAQTRVVSRHRYLENQRGIPGELLGSERFADTVRIDSRGNAVFPHFDADGLCGFEIKNIAYTSFATGGSKGIWMSQIRPRDNRIVICEGAIDALSYATLMPDERTRYASIGGKPNPLQPELIRATAALMPPSAAVIAAMDADDDGRMAAEVVREAVKLVARPDLRFEIDEPSGAKDWNELLLVRGARPLPCRGAESSVA